MNNFKKSKMKKLIMGLSCLGVLSVVNCDNEHTETRKAPAFGSVSFSAEASAGSGLTIKTGDPSNIEY